jgi:hypothetical protein
VVARCSTIRTLKSLRQGGVRVHPALSFGTSPSMENAVMKGCGHSRRTTSGERIGPLRPSGGANASVLGRAHARGAPFLDRIR